MFYKRKKRETSLLGLASTGPRNFGTPAHTESHPEGKLDSIPEQRTVVPLFAKFILVFIGDSVLSAPFLLLLVHPLVIPHRNQTRQHPEAPSVNTRNRRVKRGARAS